MVYGVSLDTEQKIINNKTFLLIGTKRSMCDTKNSLPHTEDETREGKNVRERETVRVVGRLRELALNKLVEDNRGRSRRLIGFRWL